MDFKYLHVIRKEVWNSLDVFNVIVKNTDRNEHAFLLMGFKVNEIKGRGKKNLYYVPEDSKHSSVKKCMQLFHKAEFVIWHGIFANVNLLKIYAL